MGVPVSISVNSETCRIISRRSSFSPHSVTLKKIFVWKDEYGDCSKTYIKSKFISIRINIDNYIPRDLRQKLLFSTIRAKSIYELPSQIYNFNK